MQGNYGQNTGHNANVHHHNNNVPLEPIPSPYNFVPLAKEVFFPDWAKSVSMDVPFADGISGTIQIKVTAKTPIYIRSGGVHPEDAKERYEDEKFQDFFQVFPGGPYAIPGASLKGMLRGVIEIASFGKIVGGQGAPRVSNHRYALRDLREDFYTSHITEETPPKSKCYRSKVRAAWLSVSKKNEEEWQLTFCDYARVEQADLETCFGIADGTLSNPGPAMNKYEKIKPLTEVTFDCESKEELHLEHSVMLVYRKASHLGFTKTKAERGKVVLTGQCGRKHMEFLFFNDQPQFVRVPKSVRKDFIFAHSVLGQNRQPNTEWAYWEPWLQKPGGVPVFVLMDEKKPNEVSSMGLAMMFRLPYTYSIHQTIGHTSKEHSNAQKPDLAETIFGRVERKDALRGRVSIETLVADGDRKTMTMGINVPTSLSGPKPTYYPNYVVQPAGADGNLLKGTKGECKYKTYMDEDAEIRGWKRYIVRPDSSDMPKYDPPPTDKHGRIKYKMATCFRPLKAGTTFIGTIHVHNLRPEELGAVHWAITWGGNPNLRHSLGMGKPYGFGSVTVEVTESDLAWCAPGKSAKVDLDKCQKDFVKMMGKEIPNWQESRQYKALHVIADPSTPWPQGLRYPRLGNKEFIKHKGNELARHALVLPPGVAGAVPATTNNPSSSGPIPALPKPLQKVQAVLLSEKTKKGGWKAREITTGIAGPIQNSPVVPQKAAVGDEVDLIVMSVDSCGAQIQFQWPLVL